MLNTEHVHIFFFPLTVNQQYTQNVVLKITNMIKIEFSRRRCKFLEVFTISK